MQSPLNPAQQSSPNIKDQPPVWNQPVMAWFCGLLLRSLASGGFGSSFWLKKDLQHGRSQQQHKKCQTEIKSLVKRPELDARERAYLSPPSSQNWLGRGGGGGLKAVTPTVSPIKYIFFGADNRLQSMFWACQEGIASHSAGWRVLKVHPHRVFLEAGKKGAWFSSKRNFSSSSQGLSGCLLNCFELAGYFDLG